MGIRHPFVSAKTETRDPSLVGANEWNADHTIDDASIASAKLANVPGLVPGSYVSANVTVNAAGQVTAVFNGSGGTGIAGPGTTNAIPKYIGANNVGNSQASDDGTNFKVPNFVSPRVDLGTLGSGPLDLDLTAYSVSDFVFTPALGGTIIRSIKTKSSESGASGAGQIIRLFNNGNSALPGDYVAALTQDDGSGAYHHIHLEGRQPWYVLPALGIVELRLDDTTFKWHLTGPGAFQCSPRPIPITFTLATGNVNDISPVDTTTGLNGRYASHWRVIGGAATRICGIESSAPTGGSNWNRRILIMNYGAGPLVLASSNSGGGASTRPFLLPSGDISLPVFGSQWVILDEGNNAWLAEGAH